MFLIENIIPCRNGIIAQGKFTIPHPTLVPGQQLIAAFQNKRIGLVRFVATISVHYSWGKENPRCQLSIAFDGDYKSLIGSELQPIRPE